MRILIIEDEIAAADKIRQLIQGHFPDASISGPLESVEDSVEWLEEAEAPDLIFMDIQLADGHSFDIFSETEVTSPVIFTTAFDQHALKAFQHNGLEYLLKPVKQEDFDRAMDKFKRWVARPGEEAPDWQSLLQNLRQPTAPAGYQKRLVIRYGQQIKALEISEAAYFYIESKVTILKTFSGKDYPVDQNLEELQTLLNPEEFFRINRKMIVSIRAIESMSAYTKSRVRLQLQPAYSDEVTVSSERSADFKEWLKGLPQ